MSRLDLHEVSISVLAQTSILLRQHYEWDSTTGYILPSFFLWTWFPALSEGTCFFFSPCKLWTYVCPILRFDIIRSHFLKARFREDWGEGLQIVGNLNFISLLRRSWYGWDCFVLQGSQPKNGKKWRKKNYVNTYQY